MAGEMKHELLDEEREAATHSPTATLDFDGKDEGPPPTCGKVFSLSRPEWPALLLSLVLTAATEASGLAAPIILAEAYNTAIDPELPPARMHDVVRNQMVLVFTLHVISVVAAFVKGCIIGLAGERVVARLRNRLYRSILGQEIAFFDQRKSGELVSRLGSDTEVVKTATTASLPDFIGGLVKVVVAMALMFYISSKLTSVILSVAFGLLGICVPFGKWIAKISKRYQDALGKAQTRSTEALGSMRTVRAFVAEQPEATRYEDVIGLPDTHKCWWPAKEETTYRLGGVKVIAGSVFSTFIFGFGFGAMYISLWVGFGLVIDKDMTFGDLMAFQTYIFTIGGGLAGLSGNITNVFQAKGAATRIFELLDRQPRILDAQPLGAPQHAAITHGAIQFENVTFSYPSRPDVPVLRDFSLVVEENTQVALCGSSGSGKSTCVSLVQRFYDIQSGRVLVGGKDVREIPMAVLRTAMGYVQQEPQLFGMSIRDNVCYGTQHLGIEKSDAEIEAACRQANAHEFINDFPKQYETMVGERGVQLSGGQKQRLAIARALLVNPRILLLDEATSALDAESEHVVQAAIEAAMIGRTTLIVAHRLSTIRNADKIVVFGPGGMVAGVGRHEELLAQCDAYAQLIQHQTDGGGTAMVAQ